MNIRIARLIFCMCAIAALIVPMRTNAQSGKGKHHHYKLIDIGTFGGPQSYIVETGIPRAGTDINNSGVFTGFADTSTPDFFPAACFNPDCFVSHAFQRRNRGMNDLGALLSGLSSAPAGISASGLIAGFSQNGVIDPLTGVPELRAVLWQNGGITDLGTLPEGGYESAANAVNSSGQVVGVAMNTVPDSSSLTLTLDYFPPSTQVRAFEWERGVMQDLGTLGGTDAVAAVINERGQVLGWSYTSTTQAGACFPFALGSFIWERGKGMRSVGNLGGTCTEAMDINNRGLVVGFSLAEGDTFSRAFLSENGSIQDLGGSLGGNSTGAFKVNEAGQAVGFGYLAGNTLFHAALWRQVGHITDLGTVGDDACSRASDINAQGQIVGGDSTLAQCLGEELFTRAFLWEDGAIFDLNTLIPPGSSLYLIDPETISDQGEIAGNGLDASGNQHAFLLIPCDENHPGIEGCDYSLVDPATLAEVHPPQITTATTTASSQTKLSPVELMARFRSAQARSSHRFATRPTSPQ